MADPNKVKRGAIKSSLTRFINRFNSIKDNPLIDLIDLENRLRNAEQLLEQFNDIQLTIESADVDYETNSAILHEPERKNFEDDFYRIISAVKKFVNKHNDDDNSSQAQSQNSFNNIQLPTLNLPMFDGSFDQWLYFRDSFHSIIHENNSLTNVQKFHYLRSSLQGVAAETLKSLQICDDNYPIAWNLLLERFENKPLLINSHIKALFNLPTITKETHEGLRQLLDGMQKNLRSLKVLGRPTDHWDDLIIYLISTKLDNTTRRSWESQNHSGRLPTMDELINFLKERCRILETLTVKTEDVKYHQQRREGFKEPFGNNKKSKSFFTSQTNCTVCKKEHNIYSCPDFVKLTPFNRLNTAKRLRLCINCLCNNHLTKDCKSTGCRRCGKIHHTLLHFEDNKTSNNTEQNSNKSNTSNNTQISESSNSNELNTANSLSCQINTSNNTPINSSQILLSTAVVKVVDKFGNSHDCRVLLDNGSQSNLISERFCKVLQLPTKNIYLTLSGVNEMQQNINKHVSVTFKSKVNNFIKEISCLVLPHITGNLPSLHFDATTLNIPQNLTLADSNFNQPTPIDLLIGADTFWDLLCIGQVKLGKNLPTLHKTKLGWIISGPLIFNSQNRQISNCHFLTNNDINNLESQLAKFWEIEECPRTKFFSEEETLCESHFTQNITQNIDGRFIVSLPLKKPPSTLGESRQIAVKRFYNLERKLERDSTLKAQYHDFINEYIQLGHMTLAQDQTDNSGYFLPHHCVLKESSVTTKLRVVFDGSCKSSSGFSLNDIMMVGPSIQDNLFLILLRFRRRNFVLSADVAKMYRQILVQNNDRNLQKIIWRFDPNEELSVYSLNTVTYGTASASFLAIRSLHEIAHRHKNENPKIASIILHDFYVDDLLTGCDNEHELHQIKSQISKLLDAYGFRLRKWISNHKDILFSNELDILQIGHEENNKTLGLLWNPAQDCLQYSINIGQPNSKISKRQILSCTAQIFDPLGLLAPVTITAKIILQELWKLKLSWDESIPANLHTQWSNYYSEILKLNEIRIPRHVVCVNPVSIKLHGFSDASQSAYGACIYVLCYDAFGNYTSNLYCAKTRVAPLKFVSIPRLELCGALLLAELTEKVVSSLAITFESITFWTDSTIVIAWINTSPHLLKTFVANRVSQIQTFSKTGSWKYVNTLDNPADLLSRGLSSSSLIKSDFWFHGPSWLTLPEDNWPSYTHTPTTTDFNKLPELALRTPALHTSYSSIDEIKKYSSLPKLKRIFAYVLRFKNNLLKPKYSRQYGSLTTVELNESLNLLIRNVQQQAFSEEYSMLSNSKPLNSKSKLIGLNPFFDLATKLIRVGGRLQNSKFNFMKKHPVVLPPKHHLTILIVRNEHIRLLHAGPQALLASLRETYWPLSARNLIRKTVHDCISCYRFNAKPEKYLMGNLPSDRVTPMRPFTASGIDFAGPFLLRDRKGRNFKTTKAYIALFICCASKALHLEVVSDLTTECFMAALRRFMSRRGKCSQIYSDNGTTFVGANNEIQTFFDTYKDTISGDLSDEGIHWHFIPPRAPHFGGIWESGVKSVKYHLKRVIGKAALTFEEFCTVLYQIEACLNSRPLYPLSHDPNDTSPITPAHLLIGQPLTTLPECQLTNLKESYLSRFQRMQQLLQHFWSRWSKEYISCLQQRIKWKENFQQFLQPGLLVLIKDDGLPPLKWQMGRILKIHPGSDGITRSVTIKTTSGELKRPVVKICVLPGQLDE